MTAASTAVPEQEASSRARGEGGEARQEAWQWVTTPRAEAITAHCPAGIRLHRGHAGTLQKGFGRGALTWSSIRFRRVGSRQSAKGPEPVRTIK
jgi:hypothetical protein